MGLFSRRQHLKGLLAVAATALPLTPRSVLANDNSRPLKLIAQEAGAQSDTVARIFAPALSRALNQDVVIENHGGAGGRIAARMVAKATPDGNTIGFGGGNNLVLATLLDRDPGYDVDQDFRMLSAVARVPFAVAVRNELPVSDIAQLVALARSRPGHLTYGSAGVGGSAHLTVAMIAHHHGVEMVHVPFRGTNLATTELIADRIDVVATDLARLIPFARENRLRIIAVTGGGRSARWPKAATLHEQGMRGFYLEPWYGMYAPRGMTEARAEQLAGALAQAQLAADTRERAEAAGVEYLPPTRQTLTGLIASDRARYTPLLAALQLKVGQ